MHFHAEGQQGSALFATFFASLPIPSTQRHAATAKFFGVSERTLFRWLSGDTEPPRAAVAALWHESPFGRAVMDEHAHRGHMYERGAAAALRAEVSTLRAYVARLEAELAEAARNQRGQAANAGSFNPGQPRTPYAPQHPPRPRYFP